MGLEREVVLAILEREVNLVLLLVDSVVLGETLLVQSVASSFEVLEVLVPDLLILIVILEHFGCAFALLTLQN